MNIEHRMSNIEVQESAFISVYSWFLIRKLWTTTYEQLETVPGERCLSQLNPSLLNPNTASPCRTRRLLDCRSGNRVRLVRLSRFLPFTAIQHHQPDHQEACQEKGYPELFRFAIHFVTFQRRELRCPVSGLIFLTKPLCLPKNSHPP